MRVDPKNNTLLVDAHTHIYDRFDLEVTLDAALDHFRRGAGRLGLEPVVGGCLMLCETSRDHFFQKAKAGRVRFGRWTVEPTAEAISLVMRRDDGARLIVVAGRQIMAAAWVEVLALGTDRTFADDLPVERSLREVFDSGAIAVVPWGCGRWWFGRHAVVRGLLRGEYEAPLFVGDSFGRPRGAPEHRLFGLARDRQRFLLPGTAAFNLDFHQDRLGQFGFVVEGEMDLDRPAQSIKDFLYHTRTQPRLFGGRCSWWEAIRDQWLLRWYRRTWAARVIREPGNGRAV